MLTTLEREAPKTDSRAAKKDSGAANPDSEAPMGGNGATSEATEERRIIHFGVIISLQKSKRRGFDTN